MYVRVTYGRFSGASLTDVRRLVQERLLPYLRTQPGCHGAWWLEPDDPAGAALLVIQLEDVGTWERLRRRDDLRAIERRFAPYLLQAPGGAGLWL